MARLLVAMDVDGTFLMPDDPFHCTLIGTPLAKGERNQPRMQEGHIQFLPMKENGKEPDFSRGLAFYGYQYFSGKNKGKVTTARVLQLRPIIFQSFFEKIASGNFPVDLCFVSSGFYCRDNLGCFLDAFYAPADKPNFFTKGPVDYVSQHATLVHKMRSAGEMFAGVSIKESVIRLLMLENDYDRVLFMDDDPGHRNVVDKRITVLDPLMDEGSFRAGFDAFLMQKKPRSNVLPAGWVETGETYIV